MPGGRQRAGAEKEGSPRQRGRDGNEPASKGSPEVSIKHCCTAVVGVGLLVWLISGCVGCSIGDRSLHLCALGFCPMWALCGWRVAAVYVFVVCSRASE